MNRYMHEEYYNDPELFRRLANRERNRAIGEAVIWLSRRIVALVRAAKERLTPRSRSTHWLARIG